MARLRRRSGGGGMPHTQIGQKGKGTGAPKPVTPGASPGLGGIPPMPPKIPSFLPMTPGFEHDQRQANDQLSGAEGNYAASQIMTPAQIGLQKNRLNTDMGVATSSLKDDLAGRGIFTARNAEGGIGGTSPAGGGVGESLYRQKVATPFGRQFQDLASQGAGAYSSQMQDMGGAMLGYNQNMMDSLLGRASDSYQQQPMSIPFNYKSPNQANPMFSNKPRFGRTRPNGKKGPGTKRRALRGGR